MGGESTSPGQPAANPPSWATKLLWAGVGVLAVGLLGGVMSLFTRGMDGYVRDIAQDVIKKDAQIQEVLKVSKETRDRQIEIEKSIIQIQADNKAQAEFLQRMLDAINRGQ